MANYHALSTGTALALFGALIAFAGCSGSVTNSAGCDYDGKHYAVGDTFPDKDGCNTCSCGERGDVECTLLGCGPGPGPSPACDSLVSEMKSSLAGAQQCMSAADCGQAIPGSSCGCTRDLVARKDADLAPYLAQRSKASELGCLTEGGSTCDCPSTDGYACNEQVCAWNYVNIEPEPNPACEAFEVAELCVRGTVTTDGELLAAGDQLRVTVRSAGCLSSSCSKVIEASCSIAAGVAYEVKANFCVANTATPDKPCTDDCGTAGADCRFDQPLAAGEQQVKLGSLAVGFQVPSKLPHGGLCASTR